MSRIRYKYDRDFIVANAYKDAAAIDWLIGESVQQYPPKENRKYWSVLLRTVRSSLEIIEQSISD